MLCSNNPSLLHGLPMTVSFITQNNAPLPDPRYLALHTACAKVAHLSGAEQHIDSVDRDIDTTLLLARDKSSSRVLVEAITRIAIMVQILLSLHQSCLLCSIWVQPIQFLVWYFYFDVWEFKYYLQSHQDRWETIKAIVPWWSLKWLEMWCTIMWSEFEIA